MSAPIGRYDQVLDHLDQAGCSGLTWVELAAATGISRTQASGALSNLLKQGRVIKLPLTRDGRSVYLHPDYTEISGSFSEKAEDAFDRGFAQGMSEGYANAGITAHSEGYQQGWEEGTLAFARKLNAHLGEMARAIRAEQGTQPTILTDRSWMTHPSHTLIAVHRWLRRATGVSQPDQPLPSGIVDLTARRESR